MEHASIAAFARFTTEQPEFDTRAALYLYALAEPRLRRISIPAPATLS